MLATEYWYCSPGGARDIGDRDLDHKLTLKVYVEYNLGEKGLPVSDQASSVVALAQKNFDFYLTFGSVGQLLLPEITSDEKSGL